MRSIKKTKSTLIPTSIFFLLVIYFCYQAITGDHGLLAYISLNNRVHELSIAADRIHSERLELEHKVSLLKPSSLDLDMLEEQSRKLLGYAHKDETVQNFPISKK